MNCVNNWTTVSCTIGEIGFVEKAVNVQSLMKNGICYANFLINILVWIYATVKLTLLPNMLDNEIYTWKNFTEKKESKAKTHTQTTMKTKITLLFPWESVKNNSKLYPIRIKACDSNAQPFS